MGDERNISTIKPLCNFTTFKKKMKMKMKTKKKTKTKLVFKKKWPFFRIVRSEDRAANAIVSAPAAAAAAAAAPTRNANPNEPSPSKSNVGDVVAEKVSDHEEGKCEEDGDEMTTWVAFAFDDTCDDEEHEEVEGEENKIIFKSAEPADAELEFGSCYDDARSSFRPSSSCCGDIAFKIDEEGGLAGEDAHSADVLEFDLASRQSAPPPPTTTTTTTTSDLKLIRRPSAAAAAASPLASFIAKTARNVGYPQHVVSMLLWMSFKRRVLAVAVAQVRSKAGRVNVRMRKAVGGRIGIAGAGRATAVANAEEELWERRIVMGRRCHAPWQEDSPYDNDDESDDERRSPDYSAH